MDQEHNKFTEVELLIGGLFTLAVDGAAALIDVTGVGAVLVAPVIQWFTTFTMWLWFRSKGDPGALKMGRQIFKYAIQLLPVTPVAITALTTFIPFLIEAYLHNHPEKFGLLEKALRLKSAAGAVKTTEGGKLTKAVAGAKAYRAWRPEGVASTADIAETAEAMGIPQPIE